MNRNLASRDFERNDFITALDLDIDLGPCRSLHPADPTVLWEFDSGNHLVIDLNQTVSGLQSNLLRRATGNDLEHYCRIVRNIELNAYSVKIASKLRFRLLQICRRHINRMRVEF